MVITEQTKNLPPRADPSDFAFLQTLIEELKKIPTKEKVHFPTLNHDAVYADIEATLGYDRFDKPYGEFFFRTRRHGLEMAHSAVVMATPRGCLLNYQLIIQPCKRLRSNKHKNVCSTHATPKDTALAMCRAYRQGTVTRKVVTLPETA